MKIVETTFERLPRGRLVIGFEGENLRATVRIDCSSVFAEYPNATPTLIVKPLFADAYPVVVDRNGTDVDWLITSEILSFTGDGEIQLVFYKDEVICKSAIAKIRVSRSLTVTGEMPDPVVQWIENANRKLAEVDAQIVELEGMVDTATDAATSAEQSASTASTKAEQAAGSAATATEKATEATNAAGTATAKAAEAALSATQANNSAVSAADSERGATAKAGEATTAAGTATTKATEATEAAQTATEKAGDASASARAAQESATDAAASATAASASETAAKASETAAGASATQAAQSAQTANTAAQTATQKAAEAQQSATGAAQSEQTATTKAEEAAESAQTAQEAKTAVEQTAEQLAESLEQIEQNTQDIAELDERKANIDGYYPDMTVGNAEQLNSSKYVENSEPYTFRTSGGSSDIGNREYVDAVVGGTLAWNQAVRDEASENSTDFAPIVTVTDAVADAAGVKVKIEPVQDLHGYDHPWPAGGGKNLFNPAASAFTVSDLYHGQMIGTGNGESIAISLIDKGNNADISGIYFGRSGNGIDSSSGITWLISNGNIAVMSNVRTDMPYVTIYGDVETTLAKLLNRFNVQAEITTTPTEWTPYSNICPITGWDGVKVTRTGKNLWNKDDPTANNGYYNLDGSFNYNPAWRAIAFSCQQGFTYTKSGDGWGGIVTYWYDDTFVSSTNASTVTVPSGVNNVRFACQYSSTNAQLELSSTATDYEPYAGNTYDITLPTEAGTVYGGTLDVTTGELVVKYALSVLDGDTTKYQLPANWYSNDMDAGRTSLGFYWYFTYRGMESWPFPQKYSNGIEQESHYKCDSLVASRFGIYGNDNHNTYWIQANDNRGNSYVAVRIPISALEDTSTAALANQSAMDWLRANPVTIAYEIAEPQTYQLTPAQITTLLGTNNVWADTGDLALTYTGTDEHLTLESGKKYLSRISGTDSMLLGSGQEITAAKGTDNVFDLTQMFGTAVADYVYGQGAAFFRKWFGKQWYPYNAGELRHVEGMSAHEMVGFNQWDEEWELGYYDINTGEKKETSSQVRSKNPIPVLPNTRYSTTSSKSLWGLFYDGDGKLIEGWSATSTTAGNASAIYGSPGIDGFLTPPNAASMSFYAVAAYGTTYKHDICISIAHNGSRNGEYEPYEKHSYPLDSSVILRGIPKVGANGVYWDGDRYLPDGTVERRYGVVDLGTLNYAIARPDNVYPYGHIDSTDVPNKLVGIANLVSDKYRMATRAFADEFTIHQNASINKIYIMDSTLAVLDAAQVKAALSGVYLVYELATPTTETAQPYHSTQWVNDWGTEEFVSTGIVPVGHETRYPANLRDKLQHLPDAASGNGSYLITQTDGQMVLTPFPAPPSTAGNYVLKATVVNGVATYTWEVAT